METNRSWRIDFHMEDLQQYLLFKGNGLVLLNGYSGCGKTFLLKSMKRFSKRPVYLFSYREIVDEMIRTNCTSDYFLLEIDDEKSIIGIEDVDYLYGKSATQKYLARMIQIAAEKHLVILTGNDMHARTPILCKNCEPYVIVANAIV